MPMFKRIVELSSLKSRIIVVDGIATGALAIGIAAQSNGFIILARFFGAEQFGVLTTLTAATNLASVWTSLGGGEAMRRRVSRDSALYSTMLGHGLLTIFATGLVLTA